jgi:hypothetical protein
MRRNAVSLLVQASQLAAASQANATGLLLKRAFADSANLKKTALHDFHVANGGEQQSVARRAATAATDGALCEHVGRRHPGRRSGALALKRWGRARRQDGALRRLVHAHPVQGLHHGVHPALPRARLALRRGAHVRPDAQGAR